LALNQKLIFFLQLHGVPARNGLLKLQREPFHRVLTQFSRLSSNQINLFFHSLDISKAGFIEIEKFLTASKNDVNFAVLYEPNRNFCKRSN
jgi:hypothetical protein